MQQSSLPFPVLELANISVRPGAYWPGRKVRLVSCHHSRNIAGCTAKITKEKFFNDSSFYAGYARLAWDKQPARRTIGSDEHLCQQVSTGFDQSSGTDSSKTRPRPLR